MTWWMYAMCGSILLGLQYVLIEKVLTVASPILVIFLPSVMAVIVSLYYYKTLFADMQAVMIAENSIRWSSIGITVINVIAVLAVYKAIQMSNATIASMIEITYPLFVIMFAYILLGEIQISGWTGYLGGSLIIIGAILVVHK